MSAAELRKAARTLRELAGLGTIPGPWVCEASDGPEFIVRNPSEVDWTDVARTEYREEAAYIAAMHPGVGSALVDALVQAADMEDFRGYHDNQPLDEIARLINGGAS